MAEPDELDEQEFEILDALAGIADVGDFRLTEFMRQHGMNPGQPTIFYRKLIMEARQDRGYKKFLDDLIDYNHKEIAKLEADVSSKDLQIKALKASVNKLENETRQKESERQELEAAASGLQEMAENYQLLKEFLRGRMHSNTVQVLYHFFYELHMAQLSAEVGRQPPPNSGRLEKIRQKLREEFRDMLHVPKQERDTLQKENRELRERYQGLVDMLKRTYGGEGDRAH